MKFSLDEVLARLPLPATSKWPDGVWDIETIASQGLSLILFAPRTHDYQTAHDQDELYFFVRGEGALQLQNEQIACAPGDVVYVKAGEAHRFVKFSEDFAAWVVFWGTRSAPAD